MLDHLDRKILKQLVVNSDLTSAELGEAVGLSGSAAHRRVGSLRDRGLKQLTSDGSNDDPSWAPDARHLVFVSNRGGTRQLWVIDVESGRTRQLTRGPSARLPAWSPRLGG